jgi:hypothetical protein
MLGWVMVAVLFAGVAAGLSLGYDLKTREITRIEDRYREFYESRRNDAPHIEKT